MKNETDVAEYPADWDAVSTAETAQGEFVRLETDKKVRLHVVSGPFAFQALGVGEGKEFRNLNLPIGAQVPGYKLKAQYAFEVAILDGPNRGQRKVWACGQMVAKQLRSVKDEWGDITKADIVVIKTGKGLTTKYGVTAVPPAAGDYKATLDLRAKVKFATKDDLNQLAPAPQGTAQTGDLPSGKISVAQSKLISDLATQKELGLDSVLKMVLRKYDKKELDDLTVVEASNLIETIKNL